MKVWVVKKGRKYSFGLLGYGGIISPIVQDFWFKTKKACLLCCEKVCGERPVQIEIKEVK